MRDVLTRQKIGNKKSASVWWAKKPDRFVSDKKSASVWWAYKQNILFRRAESFGVDRAQRIFFFQPGSLRI